LNGRPLRRISGSPRGAACHFAARMGGDSGYPQEYREPESLTVRLDQRTAVTDRPGLPRLA